jgi:hypothetical protein
MNTALGCLMIGIGALCHSLYGPIHPVHAKSHAQKWLKDLIGSDLYSLSQ